MQKYIIPIGRASEKLINRLIDAGILYVDDTGIHVTEKSCADQSKQD